MAREGFVSIESIVDQAERFMARGRIEDAERCYRELVSQTHVVDYEYDDWLRSLAEIYKQLSRPREAGLIYLYLHYFDLAREAFAADGMEIERARIFEVEKRWAEAADSYQRAHCPAHTAVAWERAEDYEQAARSWNQLVKSSSLSGLEYEAALVHFNYGMATVRAAKDIVAGKHSLVDSQRRLERVADDFETRGERERAFDCYQILLNLGREYGQFENLSEGYVNCIRILKADNLKFYVLQYYEDFIALATERGELHAASTLFEEAADYAGRTGLPYDRHYHAQAAQSWIRCAEKYLEDGAPIELTENALLASISNYSVVGNYVRVGSLFERLADLDLPDAKRKRYRAIARKYATADQDKSSSPGFPEYLKQRHAYADIWFVDVLEWEMGGDAYQVGLSIVGNLKYPNGIRRRALVVVLRQADAQYRGQADDPETLARVADYLGELQCYAALRPLERFYEHPDPRVRRAAVRALRFLFFKRAFVLIRRVLNDPDETVRAAAIEAISGLTFPHAFNPLVRIYRDTHDPEIRNVTLEAIGKIQSIEAGEFLVEVLRQETGTLRDIAAQYLGKLDNSDALPILKQYYEIESNPQIRKILAGVLDIRE